MRLKKVKNLRHAQIFLKNEHLSYVMQPTPSIRRATIESLVDCFNNRHIIKGWLRGYNEETNLLFLVREKVDMISSTLNKAAMFLKYLKATIARIAISWILSENR